MKAIKRINHNAAICEDGAGRQLIALGRGIGFGEYPHEVPLESIQRTFYGVDPKYLAFIDEVDPAVLEFAAQFADIVTQQVSYELSANLPITLADHFQFAIKRAQEHIMVPMPLACEVEQSHPVEYKLGELAVRGLMKTFNVRMPRDEAVGVALSISNSKVAPSVRETEATRREVLVLERAAALIEEHMDARVNRDSFSYARFTTHIRYLLKRMAAGESLATENADLFDVLAQQYPEATVCAEAIGALIERAYGMPLSREELVYLIMHINRIVPPPAA